MLSVRGLYTLMLWLALPFALARLWWRGLREPGYRRHVGERLGRYAERPARRVIWLHAVSVGETRAAMPLVRALQRRYPDHAVLVTCMTAAGRETVQQLYGDSVLCAYLPYDLPGAMQRFLKHFRPALGIMMETEVWPNMLAACRAREVPVMLANARMSRQSARGYRRFAALTRPAFESFAAVCAQDRAAARRLRALGAGRLIVCGNLKFDVQPDAAKVEEGRALMAALRGRHVLLLASTRDGEEKMLIDSLGDKDDGTLIAIVPRHQKRFDAVAELLVGHGFKVARRSLGEAPHAGRRILLGDTMGEMSFYYALATVAIIGGSFQPLGGQNLIEACAAGVPVIVGPHMFNFAEATRLAVEAGAAVQVANAAEAVRTARDLLASADRRAAMALAGMRMCAVHRGAAERHLTVARILLRAPAPS
ncbi:MAG TPA: lipid IV(A) 3-deoxy-D-manno-octulosonic acid transferase [Burkholderiales bacterium]|nr:lipid IV(A) 3-deoxy-D-manno-octulosonic acid transferase [Burkholderiales bacterium]